ncbi:dickkopf-related protein 3-like [Hirundo rustica]|uniref:dickkopf-related protein 3-like n=1 Tax=Hirundo rustica TaxID=43150 RepID=UPI001A942E43|nr:dickkopf-related protein 3-like [Hirundo rustica]
MAKSRSSGREDKPLEQSMEPDARCGPGPGGPPGGAVAAGRAGRSSGAIGQRAVLIGRYASDAEVVSPCSPAAPCAQGHFCDEHFGLCLPARPAGHYCRHDPHCARGLVCMFGKCQQPAPPGQDGARCQRDEECGAGGCCARQHGERVCQRRLALAQSCHVPPGGLAFSINQVCPCQAGLVCRPSVPAREKAFEYRPEKSEWRCRQP